MEKKLEPHDSKKDRIEKREDEKKMRRAILMELRTYNAGKDIGMQWNSDPKDGKSIICGDDLED